MGYVKVKSYKSFAHAERMKKEEATNKERDGARLTHAPVAAVPHTEKISRLNIEKKIFDEKHYIRLIILDGFSIKGFLKTHKFIFEGRYRRWVKTFEVTEQEFSTPLTFEMVDKLKKMGVVVSPESIWEL